MQDIRYVGGEVVAIQRKDGSIRMMVVDSEVGVVVATTLGEGDGWGKHLQDGE